MIKKLTLYGLFVLFGFFMGYKGFIHYYPQLLFLGAKYKIGGKENTLKHAKLPDDTSRFVVKPNPDFLYSTRFYDLTNGPLLIEADVSIDSYWSVALYLPNTVNFYVQNSDALNDDKFQLYLYDKEVDACAPLGVTKIKPKAPKGLVLFRFLVTDTTTAAYQKIKQAQQSIRVTTTQCE